jgi:hypothetical protein
MKTISLKIENKDFKIGLDDEYAQEIENIIFNELRKNENNSIKNLLSLVIQQSYKNIELNAKISTILNKMSI